MRLAKTLLRNQKLVGVLLFGISTFILAISVWQIKALLPVLHTFLKVGRNAPPFPFDVLGALEVEVYILAGSALGVMSIMGLWIACDKFRCVPISD
jgi:hypothetical protein